MSSSKLNLDNLISAKISSRAKHDTMQLFGNVKTDSTHLSWLNLNWLKFWKPQTNCGDFASGRKVQKRTLFIWVPSHVSSRRCFLRKKYEYKPVYDCFKFTPTISCLSQDVLWIFDTEYTQQDCFDCTDCSVFREAAINGQTRLRLLWAPFKNVWRMSASQKPSQSG